MKNRDKYIEDLEDNDSKMKTKLAKYKDQLAALQETIKEHQTAQAELHEKLNTEVKNNSELNAALTKKDEKLKKKDKLYEEESKANKLKEKELEKMEKDKKNLETLIKNLEKALAKKEKQYTEATEKLNTFKQIQAQIFSLSKTVSSNDDSTD